jgi:hypothetical protein
MDLEVNSFLAYNRILLDQTAEAHRYVETGRKIGNVIITVGMIPKLGDEGQ